VTDSSGNYSAQDLDLGIFTVLMRQTNYQTTELQNVDISANPFTQNGTLSGKTTQISGVVDDSTGTPLPTALVEISDPEGTVLSFLPTGVNGAWSTDQLPPGTYSVNVTAPGFKPASPLVTNLLAGTPIALASALPACATDDDDDDAQPSNFEYVLIGLGNFIKDATGATPPQTINVAPIPAAGPCPDAQAAAAAARQALQTEVAAGINWQKGYAGTSEALGATGAQGILTALQTSVDALAAFTPVGSAAPAAASTLTGAECRRAD
jgi:hypothetical protein